MANQREALSRCLAGVAALAVAVSVGGHATAVAAGPALPDGRGYELVSAADKNGGDVMGYSDSVRVAEDGTAVSYASLAVFGDSIGGGVATEYLGVRAADGLGSTGQGWATHGILPPQAALTFKAVTTGFEPRYQHDLSADLSTGVLFAWRPLTDDPFVPNVANLYLRDDLKTPGKGRYELISSCPLCVSPLGIDRLGAPPQFVASTPDFGHVLFESALNLAAGATGSGTKLYEWERATQLLRLVGILPSGTPAADAAAGTGHGPYAHPHAISADGREVFFMADAPVGRKNVYMRLDGATTIQLNRSEAARAGSPQSARYWDSSVSGSRVFFTSGEALTDDAPSSGDEKLYMYDTTKPDTDPHNLTYVSVDNEPSDATSNVVKGVVGASADGRTVYFFDTTQLVAGATPLRTSAGMYAWHDGQISFVSDFFLEDELYATDGSNKAARVSPEGDLVYLSTEPVGPNGYDHGACANRVTGACAQVYVYRIGTHELRCASCNPTGVPGRASAETYEAFNVGGGAVIGHFSRFVTDDGRRVFFTTVDALVPQDVNGKRDAYEFDTTTGVVSLISSGRSTGDSYYMEATPSGDDAFFITRERLVGWDVDDNYDLYDARVGGGFPEPVAARKPCDAVDCRGPLAELPALGGAASALVRGSGNVGDRLKAGARDKRRCRRGQVRKRVRGKVRCVRRGRGAAHDRRHAVGTRRSR